MRRCGLLLLVLFAAPVTRAQESKCTCIDGQGSYLYLRCPKSAPADPDPCPATRNGSHPNKPLPKPWNNLCSAQGRMACFLRRHAASWSISCSLCTKKKCCPFPNWHNCPECHGEEQEAPADITEVLDLAKSQKQIGGKAIEVAMSSHFVVVTDLPSLKIHTHSSTRLATKHEIMHLYLQRGEMARRDFEAVFGPAYEARSAMVLVRSSSTQKRISKAYFGSAGTNLLRGGGSKTTAGGYATNGFVINGKNDDDLHFRSRHMIGHLLISTYVRVNAHEKYLPPWLSKGCAHWLAKLHPRAKKFATFCQHEGAVMSGGGARSGGGGGRGMGGGGGGGGGPTVSGSGAKWEMKARKIARRGPRHDPVEAMFQASTAKQMNFQMHVRAWSWFKVFTEEEPAAFVDFVKRLREAQEPRVAAKAAWGQAPELVDERWREKVLGKRRNVEATVKEKSKEKEVEEATDRELVDITQEEDLQLLASRIRGLEHCQNVATARLLISLLNSRDSDRVREVVALVLGRTTDESVLEYLRGKGYKRAGKLGRATICRMFGELKHEPARKLLNTALTDSFWLVRANACRSLAQIGDKGAIAALTKLATTSSTGKVRIAAMAALGMFGEDAKASVPVFETNIMNRNWQVKVATCEAFRAIGSTHAVDMLIGRLDMEGGRIHDEIRTTLKDLTGVDKDWKAETWRKWWVKAKRFAEAERKMREELEKEGKGTEGKTKDRYATQKKPPNYYGIRVYARAVGYVLDISASMKQGFRVSASWQQRLGREYKANTRIGVCKEELVASIKSLDPRTRFNIVFFNDRVRAWQNAPVAAGAMAAQGASAIKNIQPKGQTNYYDALRVILGMKSQGGGWVANFADTPDTLFFLTDGQPTDGEITRADELLAWFNERNRFARLRVHVIAMGNTGVDLEFLSSLAKDNGGTFVHLTGTY